jgi:hypothetical protein
MTVTEDSVKIDYQTFTPATRPKVELEDIYLLRDSVFSVSIFNETDDLIMMTTTNQYISEPGWITYKEMQEWGFKLCPLELLEPASEIFNLQETISESSYKFLVDYRQKNLDLYISLCMDSMMWDIQAVRFRRYDIPHEQAEGFPDLAGRSFILPILFYCLTKQECITRYHSYIDPVRNSSEYTKWAEEVEKVNWPIIFVPFPSREIVRK